MKNNIIALIGARAGSKGIKNKNISNLGGFPLIAYSVYIATQCKYISQIVISSDSETILDICRNYNPNIITLLRNEKLASDTATDLEWIEDVCYSFKENLPDYIVHLRPTTPLREIKVLDSAIATMLQSPEATSLRSAHKLGESPYKMFVKSEEYWKPFMQMEKQEFYNLPRQAFPQVYHPNGYIDILKPKHILEKHNLHGDHILAYETPKVIEIDSIEDLSEAEGKVSTNTIWQSLLVGEYKCI